MNKYALLAAVVFTVLPSFQANSNEPAIAANLSFGPTENDFVLVANNPVVTESLHQPAKLIVEAVITGYSSTPEETDDTPFITASGAGVRPGIVAANFLPFGAKVRIPELFGNRVFVVEDRMHPKNDGKIDIWFSSKKEALNFGVRVAKVEIF